MKNFTNNFKQFTSRLSARWLIMALMLLLGTSSAWGAKTTLKQGETITFIFSQGDVPQNYGWNSTQLHIWDDSGNDETFDFNEQHVLVAGDWIPTNFQFFSKYEHSGWRGQTSDIGDCGGKTKLQPNTTYSVKLAGKDETDWIKNQWDTSNPNKQFKITLHCFADCTPTVSDKITIKCSSDENVVYAWVWGASTNANYNNNGWPGDQITDTDSDGVLDLTISTTENLNIIFSNGSSQTGNILGLQVGKEYTYSYKGTDYTLENIVCIEPSCTPPSAPSITINLGSICSGDYATITAGTVDGAISYSLYKGNNDAPAQTNNTGIFEVSEAASYRVTVTTCGESNKSSFVTLSEKPGPTASNYVIKDASKSKEYTGSEQTLTAEDITVNNNAGAVVSVYFKQDGNIVDPINVGDYEVYVTTAATDDICAGDVMIGTFTITCPTPAEAPTYSVTQRTTSCDETDNKLGIITLNNYDPAYAYQLNGKAVTVTNNQITDLAAGSYIVSAAKTCGSAQSDPKSGSSVTITSTDLTPTIAKKIEISGDNNICSGETTELTCNVEASKGTIDSYSWNQAGTQNGNTLTTAILNATTNYVATVTITNEGCPKVFQSDAYPVTVNPVPSITGVGNVTLCSSSTPISVAELIAETNATASNSATIKLYDGNGVEITSPININTQTTTTYKLKASTQTCSSEFVSFSLTVNSLPAAPSLISPDPVCEGTTVNLPTGYNWYDAEIGGNKVADTAIEATGTYWAAAEQNNCESATRTRYDVTVNPKPTITEISGNNSAVLYEDVVLTATGNNIDDVTWIADKGTITKDATDPKKAVLTYDQTGTVTVTATATSAAGCTSTEETKTVRFSEETCEPTTITVPANYIEIYCKYNDAPTQHDMKVDIWKQSEGQGTESYQSCSKSVGGYAYWKFNITDDANYCIRISNKEINYKSGSMCTLTRGHKYYFDIPGGWSGWTDGPNESKTQDITETQDGPPVITAPAVKTVSATSEEGSGIVTFTGKLLKTGCATGSAIWVGYQYKKADEEWPTTDVTAGSGKKQLATISNNPGSEDFTAEVNVENLEDGDYHFRAYVINGYGRSADPNNYDQGVYYGLDKLVTVRNTKTAIISVALQHADEYGNPILSTPTYCAGTTAYLLLTYVGSRPDVVNWSSTLSNTITKVDGNLYKFTVAGSETITVSAKNEENIDFVQGTIDVAAYSIPLTPMVELDKSEICSNDEDGATINVTNAQDGIQYYLYETGDDEAVQGPITGIGSLAFTGIKTAATYYVSAVNSNCLKYKVESQKRAITVIDASQNTIAIEPTTKTINPWGTVTLNVTKNSQYDYTLKCMQEDTDVTANLVINKKGDTYSIKFPKPSTAKIVDGQVTFIDIIYIVTVTLDGSVQCGTTSATSTVTLTKLIEDCD